MRLFPLFLILALLPATAFAEPRAYAIDRTQTSVDFVWRLGADAVTGSIPLLDADVVLDFQNGGNSLITVDLDAAHAVAGFPFATQAIRGPKIFASDDFPMIRFVSTGIQRDGTTADLSGNITIRGVTRPAVMHAELFRQQGTEPSELDHLAIHLTGRVNRSDFGASGWPDMVGDEVELRIRAYIDRAS